MVADHQKSASASKRGVPKCPFGELYVLHFQTDDFFLRQNLAENRRISKRTIWESESKRLLMEISKRTIWKSESRRLLMRISKMDWKNLQIS